MSHSKMKNCSRCGSINHKTRDCQVDLKSEVNNKISHPAHYGGDVPHEAIKCISAWNLNFNLGSAAKYICRAGKKNGESALDDLQKAAFYLNWEITKLKGDKK